MSLVLAGDGAGSGLDADLLGGLTSAAFALAGHNHDSAYPKIGGNPLLPLLTLGTTDFAPLEFKVNNSRVLRLEPTGASPNIIGGYNGNSVGNVGHGVVGATISGGGKAPSPNRVTEDFATIGGGLNNVSSNYAATVGGGSQNISGGGSSTVSGGLENTSSGGSSAVGGGYRNTSSGNYATVGGGIMNTSSGDYARVPGGCGTRPEATTALPPDAPPKPTMTVPLSGRTAP